MRRLTQKAFGQHVGITQPAVAKLVAHSVIDLRRGLDQARLDYCANLRAVAAGHSSEDGKLDVVEEKALLARSSRLLNEIKIQEAERELVSVAKVTQHLTEMGANARRVMLGLPNKLAPELVAASSTAAAYTLLADEVKYALSYLARENLDAIPYEDFGRCD